MDFDRFIAVFTGEEVRGGGGVEEEDGGGVGAVAAFIVVGFGGGGDGLILHQTQCFWPTMRSRNLWTACLAITTLGIPVGGNVCWVDNDLVGWTDGEKRQWTSNVWTRRASLFGSA